MHVAYTMTPLFTSHHNFGSSNVNILNEILILENRYRKQRRVIFVSTFFLLNLKRVLIFYWKFIKALHLLPDDSAFQFLKILVKITGSSIC